MELIDDLNICADESFLPAPEVDQYKADGWCVHRLINGYVRFLRERKFGENLALHECPPTSLETLDEEF
jgi:hypothetical protein